MQPILNVYPLPDLLVPEKAAGDAAVVIDVLRASTTITYALAAGDREVIPCLEVADALAAAEAFAAEARILGGERGGERIDGFDLGNSPEEYTPQRVAGKSVVFTTTNGTRAALCVQSAGEILIAGFVNATAVVQRLLDRQRIHIVCAGTRGQKSEDDVLLAGMLVDHLQRDGRTRWQQNGQAVASREFWLHSMTPPEGSNAAIRIGAPDRAPACKSRGRTSCGWAWTTTLSRPRRSTASRVSRNSILPHGPIRLA